MRTFGIRRTRSRSGPGQLASRLDLYGSRLDERAPNAGKELLDDFESSREQRVEMIRLRDTRAVLRVVRKSISLADRHGLEMVGEHPRDGETGDAAPYDYGLAPERRGGGTGEVNLCAGTAFSHADRPSSGKVFGGRLTGTGLSPRRLPFPPRIRGRREVPLALVQC
jgi:hypothetical protein